jgi:hypothetical protein
MPLYCVFAARSSFVNVFRLPSNISESFAIGGVFVPVQFPATLQLPFVAPVQVSVAAMSGLAISIAAPAAKVASRHLMREDNPPAAF